MAINTSIMTVSVPKAQVEFIEEANLSPSELIQEAINEKMRLWQEMRKDTNRLLKNIESLQQELTLMCSYLEDRNLFKEFSQWRGTYVLAKENK